MLRTASSSLRFWRDAAADLGFTAIDRNLDEELDWDRALEQGRRNLEAAVAVTGMPLNPSVSVLEIGCGIGRLVFAMAERVGQVVGLDPSPRYIALASARNRHANVFLETTDGKRLQPQAQREFDVVFAHEVFHYLDAQTIETYARDAFALLRPGGMFWFEINLRPRGVRSHAAGTVRYTLHMAGVKTWRGWATHPGFQRRVHSFEFLARTLLEAGFALSRVVEHRGNTFFVAHRPG